MASSNPGSNRDVPKDEAETNSKKMTTLVGILDEVPGFFLFASHTPLPALLATTVKRLNSLRISFLVYISCNYLTAV